jgi:hypothetical protein
VTKAERINEAAVARRTVYKRLQRGWSLDAAVTTPSFRGERRPPPPDTAAISRLLRAWR